MQNPSNRMLIRDSSTKGGWSEDDESCHNNVIGGKGSFPSLWMDSGSMACQMEMVSRQM